MNYTDHDAVNYSTLKYLVTHSPKHYQEVLRTPAKTTEAMVKGRAVHIAVLEPDRLDTEYVRKPPGMNFSTKEGKAWRAENDHKTILPTSDYDDCLAMSRAVYCHADAHDILSLPGEVEYELYWDYHEIPCKGRVDKWCPLSGTLIELKTAESIDADEYSRRAARLLYHMQLAYYYDALDALGFKPSEQIVILVESAPPYDVAVEEVHDDVRAEGRLLYERALATLQLCRATGSWPGRAPVRRVSTLPAWARELSDD